MLIVVQCRLSMQIAGGYVQWFLSLRKTTLHCNFIIYCNSFEVFMDILEACTKAQHPNEYKGMNINLIPYTNQKVDK